VNHHVPLGMQAVGYHVLSRMSYFVLLGMGTSREALRSKGFKNRNARARFNSM
jgi:hypothetical protein